MSDFNKVFFLEFSQCNTGIYIADDNVGFLSGWIRIDSMRVGTMACEFSLMVNVTVSSILGTKLALSLMHHLSNLTTCMRENTYT